MTGYESVSSNPFATRGNGSAHELFGTNPAFFGTGFGTGAGNFGTQNPAMQFSNPTTQTNPFLQQTYMQNPQAQFGQWPQQTQGFGQGLGQGFGNVSPSWGVQQQFGNFGQQAAGLHAGAPTFMNQGVYTTRAVDIEVAIPAQTVLARHPLEIQQYVLNVIAPTLIDALTKRALAHDIGQSVSFDMRGACVARVGI